MSARAEEMTPQDAARLRAALVVAETAVRFLSGKKRKRLLLELWREAERLDPPARPAVVSLNDTRDPKAALTRRAHGRDLRVLAEFAAGLAA